jgi:hypothetical protein
MRIPQWQEAAVYRPAAPALAAAVALAACGETRDAEPEVVRRDSAGIEIVHTLRFDTTSGELPVVSDTPALSIGRTEGDPKYLFGEVGGAVRLADGTIVVADRQAQTLRYYDPAGLHVRDVGGAGGGPGEFGGLYTVRLCGPGRLYADDRRRRRVIVWDARGVIQRAFDLHEPGRDAPRGPYRWVCGPNGGIIAAGWGDLGPRRAEGSHAYAQPAGVWALDSLAQLAVDLGEHIISERWLLFSAGGGGTSSPNPFGRAASFALGADRIYLGTGERLEVLAYDRDGALVRVIRGPDVDLSLPTALLDEYAESDLDEPDRIMLDRAVEAEIALPDSVPAYTDLRLDPLDHLWARRFQRPNERVDRWGVFAPDGAFLGHVAMPPGLDVQQIGDDFVLGVTRDELGVARVVVHTLRRRPPQS